MVWVGLLNCRLLWIVFGNLGGFVDRLGSLGSFYGSLMIVLDGFVDRF